MQNLSLTMAHLDATHVRCDLSSTFCCFGSGLFPLPGRSQITTRHMVCFKCNSGYQCWSSHELLSKSSRQSKKKEKKMIGAANWNWIQSNIRCLDMWKERMVCKVYVCCSLLFMNVRSLHARYLFPARVTQRDSAATPMLSASVPRQWAYLSSCTRCKQNALCYQPQLCPSPPLLVLLMRNKRGN